MKAVLKRIKISFKPLSSYYGSLMGDSVKSYSDYRVSSK